MPAEITLDLTRDGLTVLHRTAAGWDRLGSVPMSAPDFRPRAEELSRAALERSGGDGSARVILPDTQVLYTTVAASGLDRHADEERVRVALDGTTPYPLADLQVDWRQSGRTLYVAVVARETLSEAASFVAGCGLKAVSFSAAPDDNRFPGEPRFVAESKLTGNVEDGASGIGPEPDKSAEEGPVARDGALTADDSPNVAGATSDAGVAAPEDAVTADALAADDDAPTGGKDDLADASPVEDRFVGASTPSAEQEQVKEALEPGASDRASVKGAGDDTTREEATGTSPADAPVPEPASFPTFVSARRATANSGAGEADQGDIPLTSGGPTLRRKDTGKTAGAAAAKSARDPAPLPTFASVRARRLAAASADTSGRSAVGATSFANSQSVSGAGGAKPDGADLPPVTATGGGARITPVSSAEADRLGASLEPDARKGKRRKINGERSGLASLLGVFKRKPRTPARDAVPTAPEAPHATPGSRASLMPSAPRLSLNQPPPPVGGGHGSRLAEILQKGPPPAFGTPAAPTVTVPPAAESSEMAPEVSTPPKLAGAADPVPVLVPEETVGTTRTKSERSGKKSTGLAGAIGGLSRLRSKSRGKTKRAPRSARSAVSAPAKVLAEAPTPEQGRDSALTLETGGRLGAATAPAPAEPKVKLPQPVSTGRTKARGATGNTAKGGGAPSVPAPEVRPRLVPVRRATPPSTMPAPTGVAPSRDPGLTEAESLTVFGARRMQKENVSRPGPRYLGLLLTLGLVGVMGFVALSSIWFGGEDGENPDVVSSVLTEPPAPLPQDVQPTPQQAVVPVPQAEQSAEPAQQQTPIAPPPQALAAPEIPAPQEDLATAIPLPPEQVDPLEAVPSDEELAALALPETLGGSGEAPVAAAGSDPAAAIGTGEPPTEAAPETAAAIAAARPAPNDPLAAPGLRLPPGPLDLGIARAAHSATGIWLRAPERGFSPADDRLADISIASVDGRGFAAAAPPLTDPVGPADSKPPAVADPLRAESPAIFGPGGRVVATPEGALSPDGVTIYLGRPTILPPRRPDDRGLAEPGTDPAQLEAPDPLRLFRPRPRPEDLTELVAPPATAAEPLPDPGLRPRSRTASLDASTDAPEALSEALEEAGAEVVADLPEDTGTGPAAAASTAALGLLPQPRARPDDIDIDGAVETIETASVTVSPAGLAAVVPVARPERLTALAAPPEAPSEQPEEAEAEPEQFPDASELALAAVERPRLRPANIEQIAARADRRAAAASTAAAVVASTVARAAPSTPRVQDRGRGAEAEEEPEDEVVQASAVRTRARGPAVPRNERVAPTAPSSAVVAQRATVRNAVNLRQVALIGVYGTPNKRRALVRLPTGRYIKVSVGDRVDGGRVASIGESNLSYTKRGRNVVLKMPRG